ncbi:ABC transporter ATP-binding protein [Brucella pseudogrignonensis]|uniref:ABC transporter ATP-binding protein n=1 Tax=Brucella pseudogrignonensis TaxID=419475 RepID=UPI003D988577
MSSNISISVENISKCYQIYSRPEDRLLQMLWRGRRSYYKEFWALQDISFQLTKGETLAILGRNGSGKSTLLQVICGTLNPTDGKVAVDGKIAALLELGAGFNGEFTGRENVYLNGALMGISKTEMDARFHAISDFADIGDFIDQPVKTYSSGMYVRLAFAVAIHCDPEILIVDEALAVGDFLFQQKCNRFMKERFGGITKILVTHDMAAVANLADRAIVLHHGKLIYDGDPQNAIREYQIAARAEENRHLSVVQSATNSTFEADSSNDLDDDEWTAISEKSLSGTLRAKFLRCKWFIGGSNNPVTIGDGDKIRIQFDLWCSEEISSPIFGYQVTDRFGAVIFGENTVTSLINIAPIQSGVSRFALEFTWPEVASGKYSITLGIGSGFDSLSHTIECWAHNIIVLDGSTEGAVHGMFNVKISHLKPLASQ